MIYIVSGNDTTKINSYIAKLCDGVLPTRIPDADITKEKFFEYASSVNLFGEFPIIVVENFLTDQEQNFSTKELEVLRDSKTVFIFKEDKLLSVDVKKYSKYGETKDFSTKDIKPIPKFNVFNIADGFSRRDKINTWILYKEAVSQGISPEEISGIIFWKIKTMFSSGTKVFSEDELKGISASLVDLYHRSHRGEVDFVIGLEQFILSKLSK